MRTAGSCGCLLLGANANSKPQTANRKQQTANSKRDSVTAGIGSAWQLKSYRQSSSKLDDAAHTDCRRGSAIAW
ncbi:hypothetical protein XAP3CFBP6996_003250 [Xanthomonas citri pv. fuscans CFBP 6996]|nr:hypothetical protein XAP3CFBP6996_003250 [Xanthomonas citri pv. fuscans CFBP 6996]QWN14986.1 hypothetical protein DGN02_03270 [Xanthomonas citri]